jgi:glycosyltransferase involved in cell wall biosynthesis
MARLLLAALGRAGFACEIASTLRILDLAGDADRQAQLRDASLAEAGRLLSHWRERPASDRPRAWFTYHVYYKAPDWLGPVVAEALGIPYFVAEGSRARKRAEGPWALGHRGAEAALDRADLVFAMTANDRVALERDRPERQRIVDLPPFVESVPPVTAVRSGGRRLLTVAMMRPGDKLASYRLLADSLSALGARAWTLDVVGDGEAWGAVEAMFTSLGPRVRFHGRLDDPSALGALYDASDILVWPAVNEAYGMALLEAQAHGCPVVAGSYGGVTSVVRHGETGLVTPPGDTGAFARAIACLLDDPSLRHRLGVCARATVAREHTLDAAARRLRTAIEPLLAPELAPCA